jgi:host factor-I protein
MRLLPGRNCPIIALPIARRPACQARNSVRFVYNASMSFRPPQGSPNAKRGRTPPPEDTYEEASFLKTLGEKQKPVSVKLMDGQIVQGWIEYYDRNMVRLTRQGAPNLFIFKHEIMYIAEDGGKKK